MKTSHKPATKKCRHCWRNPRSMFWMANTTIHHDVQILSAGVRLEGIVSIPPDAKGIVLFVHGSCSSRFSPRNQEVALQLQDAGLITLLFDLLTEEEEQLDRRTRHLRFDVHFLAQ